MTVLTERHLFLFVVVKTEHRKRLKVTYIWGSYRLLFDGCQNCWPTGLRTYKVSAERSCSDGYGGTDDTVVRGVQHGESWTTVCTSYLPILSWLYIISVGFFLKDVWGYLFVDVHNRSSCLGLEPEPFHDLRTPGPVANWDRRANERQLSLRSGRGPPLKVFVEWYFREEFPVVCQCFRSVGLLWVTLRGVVLVHHWHPTVSVPEIKGFLILFRSPTPSTTYFGL